MKKMTAAASAVLLFVSVAWTQETRAPQKKAATPEVLKTQIETLRDAKVAWKKVDWRTCLLGALNEAAREKKPLFLWVLGGSPADGRC
jgi:hypothetical protein